MIRRWFVPAALLLAALPLLWPTIPPLIDLPNHMSRFAIQQDIGTSPYLHQWFEFRWTLVGNLGVDLLVAALAPLLGVEPATKLVVMAIPVLTVAGLALVAREGHGRVPLSAALAFVFAYNWPLNFGFVNFTLAAALALLAFGYWLRLGRLGRRGLRLLLFVPIGFGVWVAHVAGWGLLGVMVFAAGLCDRRDAGDGWLRAAVTAGLESLPLCAALVPMLLWYQGGMDSAKSTFVYDFGHKLVLVALSLRNGDCLIDMGSVGIVWAAFIVALARPDLGFDRRLATVAAALFTVFLLMPPELIGSGYADLRLAPYAMAMTALAIAPRADTPVTRAFAAVALALLAGQTIWHVVDYARLDRVFSRQLAALDHVPVGSRVFGFARSECLGDWTSDRLDHVNRMAIVRRQAYANDTWPPAASQTLRVKPPLMDGYEDLDSQKFTRPECRYGDMHSMDGMLVRLPRDRFDYLWLIGVDRRMWPARRWLTPVWHGEDVALYRIAPAAVAAAR